MRRIVTKQGALRVGCIWVQDDQAFLSVDSMKENKRKPKSKRWFQRSAGTCEE
jgi:hypothetical protein